MTDLSNPDQVRQAKSRCTRELMLDFQGLSCRVLADNQPVIELLRDYFAGLTAEARAPVIQDIYLVDAEPDISAIEWAPVRRAKTRPPGLKEAYADAPGGRWIHKVRTGMVMFQSLSDPMAIGKLMENACQVVNFINNQFLNHHQRQGCLLGHASAFTMAGETTAIAASSGGGKSTLMLRALETEGVRFLSNDRILFRSAAGQTDILGLAKHPRVNPGTLLHSERLATLLSGSERARYSTMPRDQLWEIEQKHDVLIPRLFGEGKTELSGRLKNLVLLDWALDSAKATDLTRVDTVQDPGALEGLRKNPGPFYQDRTGCFPAAESPGSDIYARNLQGVRVWRLTGSIDFDRAATLLAAGGIL